MEGSTLLHRMFYELNSSVALPVAEACAESLSVLLDAGADASRCGKGGWTPLHLACCFIPAASRTGSVNYGRRGPASRRCCSRPLPHPSMQASKRANSQRCPCRGCLWNNVVSVMSMWMNHFIEH